MVTDKKNQHYIPKFYLRNFSFKNNKAQIGVFNLNNEIYIQRAKLKAQGSKNFFYGYDGIIEDKLSDIESELTQVIKRIIETKALPKRESKEHNDLLTFVSLTDLRNPVQIGNIKKMIADMKRRLLEVDPNVDTENFVPNPTHDEVIKISLSNTSEITQNITDLEYKLLINQTKNPFITSDYPIAKYNQFLESKNWLYSKSGYGTVGLQIFIPLNAETLLLFFDSGIYKLGNRKQKYLIVQKTHDIDEINKLQFVNCFETIFFDEKATELYVRQLFQESKKFKRANVSTSELSYIFKEGDDQQKIIESGRKNLFVFGSTDCETKLIIDGLKVHSNGKAHKFNNSVAQLRHHPEKLMRNENSR